MTNVPEQLRYAKTHIWVRDEEDGSLTIGITDHAQELLGDLVYVELPNPGQNVKVGGEVAVVESVKAASDVYSPVTGEVIDVNGMLSDAPELINSDPYGEGWVMRVHPLEPIPDDTLLDASAYAELIVSESEEE
uniref:Glycine cleavage system H protein n=2 Tax=unclassified Candidatus Kentrum TaxID=2643149 RepID=A0A451ALC6_9GAMM|nr:MAG: glycine cleavage system H protein [Candidatus Kentron sp. LPFa]VFK28239.1 MAG: glycine cleavage system H protein [Candidatus Kentron sp. LPFa]VFK66818.1 MAG: glycine cleavage system H protein [Candidatus Kentron sp. UNK]VFK72273.1 MAG: glycine cleavage system H protein [Candidatus Kentron sp. UNK]